MGTLTSAYLPDGQLAILPVIPRTWVDTGPTTIGDSARAPLLQLDVSANVMWQRQRPLFQGFQSVAQSIPSGTWTAITGLNELSDNWSGHSDASNTGRYYAPDTRNGSPGDWYLCIGYVPYAVTSTSTVHFAGLRVTGSANVIEGGKISGGTGHNVDSMIVDLVQLNGFANDYVELMARQTSGSAANTVVSGKSSSLTVRYIAANPAGSIFATPTLPATPHTWTGTDILSASLTGGDRVPLNVQVRDLINFLNNPPIARLTAEGSSQTIPNGGVWTTITFPSETVDTYGGHSTSSNTSRYVAQRAGLYLVAGYASVAELNPAAGNNGYRAAQLLQTFAAGGTQTYAGMTTIPATSGTTGTAIYAVGLLRMAVGDYVELQMAQTLTNTANGSALPVTNSATNCARMIAVWMAA